MKDHNEGNFVRYNHPKDYVVCINLDVDEIVDMKMAMNEKKYPVEKCKSK